jgi:hypothetical protein
MVMRFCKLGCMALHIVEPINIGHYPQAKSAGEDKARLDKFFKSGGK